MAGTDMRTRPGGRLEELDVLRGLAAGCVVLSHYSSYCARELGAGPFGLHLPTFYGFYAVQLFFMISGFVIYFTLERSVSWRDFAFSRVSRLYPAYWTALTLMVVVESVVFGKHFWVGGYIVNSTMLLRRLVSPITLWLGAISYSLYLSHHNLGYSTISWLHGIGIPIPIGFLVTLAGAVMLATALTYAVERPALRALRQWYGTRGPVTSAPA